MKGYVCETLGNQHDRTQFDCGVSVLNDYLTKYAKQDVNHPGVGALLLSYAITRCVRVASEIAASLIVVDSKGESSTCFYKKFGFISLPNLPDRMFLPMQTAEKT